MRSLSAVFAGYPAVKDSRVDLEANAGGYYVVNSEGTEVRMPEDVTFLRMRAMAQSADGSAVRDLASFHALETAGMPGEAELMAGARELAARVTALAAAPKGEDYTGPVLFEGTAGAQLLAEVVGRNVILARKPEGGRGGAFLASEYQGRVGSRVLPESFDVVDDPTQKQWRGRPLFGAYEVDREGVAAQPVSLIEKGVLKTFLLTRQPLKGMPGSNGHGRLPGAYGASEAGIGNLFVRSSEASPAGGLKRKLIEAIQARGKPYGILVRKLDFPSSAPLDEVRRLLSETSGMAQPVSCTGADLQGVSGRAGGVDSRGGVQGIERALAEGHSGGGRRRQRFRVYGQRRAAGGVGRRFVHHRSVRGGAIRADRRSGAPSG